MENISNDLHYIFKLSFFDNLTENILVLNDDRKIIYANQSAKDLYGYKNNELLNLNFFDLIEKDSMEKDLFIYDKSFNSIHYKNDGSKFIADVKEICYDKDNKNILISVSKDSYCIFEKCFKNNSVSKYFDIINEAFVVFTKNLDVYIWSKSAEIKFGYTMDEVYGKSMIDLIPEDKLNEFEHKMDLLKNGNIIENYETQRIAKNGSFVDVSIFMAPLYNCKNKFMGAVCIYKDISEKINLENKLYESEERLRVALEGGKYSIWDWNIEAKTVYTSNLFNDLLGYDSNEMIYNYDEINDKIHKDDINYIVDKTKRHFNGEDFDIEFRMKCKDNNYKWFRSKAKVNKWSEDGKPLRMIGTHEDITDKRIMAEELKEKYELLGKLKEEAEHANNAKSKFLANMSHEIRTPLNGIFGMIQLIESTNLSNEQDKYVSLIKDSLKHLYGIINDVLDFSKIESGKMTIDEEAFDLQKMIHGIYKNLLVSGNSKGLEISYYLDPKINFIILSDELRLNQVLTNLINNAVKFTDEGFISFRTKLLSDIDNKVKIEFRVKDTGIGIGENYKDKLFQYFNQGDISSNKKYQGTGIGLAISKQIAELLNGDITFESKAGEGSVFIFTCEFKKIISEAQQEKIISHINMNDSYNKNKKFTILCIEDNIINQEVMKNLIIKKGYNYLSAYNGKEALNLLEKNNIDLILMDIQLPELNGFQITEIIRNEYDKENKIPIIAITAYAMREDREKCINAGMNDYIAKPFELEAVYKLIETYLN